MLQLLPSAAFHLVSNISSQNINLISNKNAVLVKYMDFNQLLADKAMV